MSMRPPPEHDATRWHWLETKFGLMCASWFPNLNLDDHGTWDVSGHSFRDDDPRVKEMAYLGPAIPPSKSAQTGG